MTSTLFHVTGGAVRRRGVDVYAPGGPSLSRFDLVVGTDKPTADVTGVISGITRTTVSGPVNASGYIEITTNGALYENVDFLGDVLISGPNNTFRNCMSRGRNNHPAGQRACWTLFGNANHANTYFEDCEALPQYPSWYRDGWIGNTHTTLRCKATHCNDGFGAYSPTSSTRCDVYHDAPYTADMVYWGQDPAHPDGTHNDHHQYQGGAGYRVRGANVTGTMYSSPSSTAGANPTLAPAKSPHEGYATNIQINQNGGRLASEVLIDQNWLARGYAGGVSIQKGTPSTITGVTVRRNRFDRDVWDWKPSDPDKRYVMINDLGSGYTITGAYPGVVDDNRFTDNNALLAQGRTAGIRVG